MDELTRALRAALTDPRRELPVDRDPVPDVHRGIRRRRARRSAAAGASMLLVVVAAGSALALVPDGDRVPDQPAGDRSVLQVTPSASPTASRTPTAEPSPAPTPTTAEPVFVADTGPDLGGPEAPGNGLSVVDARVGRQDGYDRVVYELAGAGEPAWRVEYVDEARQQGSGDEVPLAGRSRLSVTVLGVGYPFDTGVPQYDGPKRLPGPGTRSVAEVWLGSVYEGQYDSFIGLAGEPRPFRVFALSDPPRLVVDVRDD